MISEEVAKLPDREEEADAVYRKVRGRLVPILIVCYLSAYLDRAAVGIAKLDFMDDIGLTSAMYGLGAGIFYLGYALFEVPSNLWMKKIGARKTIFRILMLWSLVTLAMAFMQNPTHFYILRFLLGAAEAGFFPGVLLYISLWAPTTQRARFTARFMSAMAIAGIIGGPLGAAILGGMNGVNNMEGWQWLFILEGAPGLVLGFFILLFLPDRPANANWLTPREKQIIEQDLANEAEVVKDEVHGSMLDAIKDPQFLKLAVMSMALIGGLGGVSIWLATVIKEAGIRSSATVSLLTTIPYVFALVAQQMVANSADKRKERKMHVGICALIAGLSWFCVPLVLNSPWLAMIFLTTATAAGFGATGPFWSMPSAYLSKSAAAGGIAMVTTAGALMAMVSPYIVGAIRDMSGGSTNVIPFYYGTLMLLGGIAILTIRRAPTDGQDG